MLRVMLRPRWVLALLVALGIAAGFAWLGQWQLERAVSFDPTTESVTETPVPLTTIAQPNSPTGESMHGQRVTVTGTYDRQDYRLLSNRYNGGEPGFWVVGHFVTAVPNSPGLAVALGWTDNRAIAEAAVSELSQEPPATDLITITGRYLATEAPVVPEPGADPNEMTTMSVAALIN